MMRGPLEDALLERAPRLEWTKAPAVHTRCSAHPAGPSPRESGTAPAPTWGILWSRADRRRLAAQAEGLTAGVTFGPDRARWDNVAFLGAAHHTRWVYGSDGLLDRGPSTIHHGLQGDADQNTGTRPIRLGSWSDFKRGAGMAGWMEKSLSNAAMGTSVDGR